jgi:hypothetical protein
LVRNRCCFSSASNFEVVAAAAEVDDTGIVRVLQDPNEHPLIETLAVVAEDLARTLADRAGAGGIVVVSR